MDLKKRKEVPWMSVYTWAYTYDDDDDDKKIMKEKERNEWVFMYFEGGVGSF